MVPPDSSFHCQTRVDEGFAPEVVLGLALLRELPLDHVLGGDARVVGARHPERVAAVHALVADQDVLERVVERVAQVERAGDVRRRDDDRSTGFFGESASAWK